MTAEWRETRAAFHAAADWFATAVEKVGGRWSSPGLGEMCIRDSTYTIARGSWVKMADRGGDTANHMNHVHVSFKAS